MTSAEEIAKMGLEKFYPAIEKVKDATVLDAIQGLEEAKEKPRTGALNAIKERREELGTAAPAEEAPAPKKAGKSSKTLKLRVIGVKSRTVLWNGEHYGHGAIIEVPAADGIPQGLVSCTAVDK